MDDFMLILLIACIAIAIITVETLVIIILYHKLSEAEFRLRCAESDNRDLRHKQGNIKY
jgi:hypothetical protein